ncbi:hypothetical protein OEZ86_012638 [Tetradesmus obliquus]|nr:hypothetical protein OEZ86_012638 [Tetradesmus obliquus]
MMLQTPPELQATPASSNPPNITASPQPSLNGTGGSSSNDSWPFPEIPVRLMSRGDLLAQGGAVRALGRDKLLRIRQQSSVNLDVDALAQSMETDDDLLTDAQNLRLMFKCQSLVMFDNATGTPAAAAAAAAPALTQDEVFSLSSNPGASKKILLDFDGATVSGTWWNTKKSPIIYAKAYDKDNDPESFNQAELQDMKDIWRAVSEDYAPFDVDVTTKDPGDAALLGSGVRIIIGGSSADWYGSAAGGVAWVGSFGTENPAFIWPALLGPFKVKYVADAASHETGHTLGLLHDGNSKTSYYAGHGNWAPIMGVSYAKPVTQFDKGEYPDSNNQQDDFAVINKFLPLLPQKFGSSTASATLLPGSGIVSGVISNQGQADFFSFTAKGGPSTLTADVAAAAGGMNIADLNVKMTLYDAHGSVITSDNPSADNEQGLGASITSQLTANAVYYVSIAGVGSGSFQADGYSSYGSRGRYTLGVTNIVDGRNPTTDPVDCTGVWECAPCSTCSNGRRSCTFRVTSQGNGLPCAADNGQTKSTECAPKCSNNPPGGGGDASSMSVASLKIQKQETNGRVRCRAAAVVRNGAKAALADAVVIGRWSGVTAAMASDVSIITSTVGVATASSRTVVGSSCTFTVSNVYLAGHTFVKTPATLTKTLRW